VLRCRLPGRELGRGCRGRQVRGGGLGGVADDRAVDVDADRAVGGGLAGGRVDPGQQVGLGGGQVEPFLARQEPGRGHPSPLSLRSPLASVAPVVLRPPAAEALRANDVFGTRVDDTCGTPRSAGIWRAAGSAVRGLLVPDAAGPITRPSGSADPKPEHLAYYRGWGRLVSVPLIDLPARMGIPIAVAALASGVFQGPVRTRPRSATHLSGRGVCAVSTVVSRNTRLCRKVLGPP